MSLTTIRKISNIGAAVCLVLSLVAFIVGDGPMALLFLALCILFFLIPLHRLSCHCCGRTELTRRVKHGHCHTCGEPMKPGKRPMEFRAVR